MGQLQLCAGGPAGGYRPLMSYIAITVKEFVSVFRPVSLEQTAYWLNAFLSALVVIPVFFFTYEMSGLTGAITASVLSALNFFYFNRTLPGFYDTDGVILWVSCLFFYFGIKLVKQWREKNKKAMLFNGAGFIVCLAALYYAGCYICDRDLKILHSTKGPSRKPDFPYSLYSSSLGLGFTYVLNEKVRKLVTVYQPKKIHFILCVTA